MTTAAMVEGAVNQYDPGKRLNRDLYPMGEEEIQAAGTQRLPRNLLEAVEILKDDALAKPLLGDAMLNSCLAYKVDGWERYRQEVTDWELQEYLRLY